MNLDFFRAAWDVLSSSNIYEGGLRFAIVLALVAAGEWIAEKAGTINISVQGTLLAGAFASAMGFPLSENLASGLGLPSWLVPEMWLGILLGASAGWQWPGCKPISATA